MRNAGERKRISVVGQTYSFEFPRFPSRQSIHGWCHFSSAVMLCNQYLLQNEEVKGKLFSFASLSTHINPKQTNAYLLY